ncbi:MAG: Short chain fatty acid transporter [bacterium]|nr:Short chain fatty acid transporter [bacterium]
MDGRLARIALALTRFAERWLPDAFVFALAATVAVFIAGVAIGVPPLELVAAWGNGFSDLLAFAMQMALVIVTGYVVATARPVRRAIEALARVPSSARGAVAFVAAFAMATSWINWGFSLVFSAVLARAIARRFARDGRRVDYRALGASSLLGLGSVWAQGLSGSAALQMATPSALPPAIRAIIAHDGAGRVIIPDGIVSFAHTVFLWQSLASVAIELVVVTLVMWLAAPSEASARDAATLGIALDDRDADGAKPSTPGEKIEHSPALTLAFVALAAVYLARTFAGGLTTLTVNTINLALLCVGMLLHWTPARLMRAVREAVPATWGVILQFPFYAAIAGMIATTRLNDRIAHLFVSVSSARSFPALMSAYSALLGIFVPSGGSKWIIEAPYVIKAAHELRVHIGWVVACYDLGEAAANLVQPFWMLPVLALLGLRARDVMGYTFLVFLVLLPLVLVLTTLLGTTLPYPL